MQEEDVVLDDSERTRCEVWTRVMGYYRPIHNWNKGKQSEYKERKTFDMRLFNQRQAEMREIDNGNQSKDI